MSKYILIIFMMLMLPIAIAATPTVPTLVSPDDDSYTHGSTINLNATSTAGVGDNIFIWYYCDSVDGSTACSVEALGTPYSYSINTSEPGLYYWKTEAYVGASGSGYSEVWEFAYVPERPKETATFDTVNESGHDIIMDSISGEPSFDNFIGAVSDGFENSIGSLFWLFLFGVPIIVIYIRTESITIPGILGIILGAIIISTLPGDMQGTIYIFIVLFASVVVYLMVKDRR